MHSEKKSRNKKPMILVVDDQPENLKVAAGMLQPEYTLAFANNGKNTLSLLKNNKPDLILLDIMMPDMDGYMVCKKIKQNPHTKEIPVIFLSAKSDIQDIVKGFQHGAVDYITKPFNALEVKVRVENHLKIQNAVRDKLLAEQQKQTLEKEIQLAKNTLKFKQNFLASLSHEIRTPLTGIMGVAELMQATNLDPNQKEYLNHLWVSVQNMRAIIDKILDYTGLEPGKIPLFIQPYSLNKLIIQCRDFFHQNCEKKIIYRYHIDNQLPDRLSFDYQRIMQVAKNLLSNAITHTFRGEIYQELTLCEEISKNQIRVKVQITDTGKGIDPKSLKTIFTPFSQVHKIESEAYTGLGLGLSLCKKIVQSHGGEINIKSQPGKGTTVWFTFTAEITPQKEPLPNNILEKAGKKHQHLRILLAEDKVVTQKVVKMMLSQMGHTVQVASNGQEVLELFDPKKFDLILMDIQMPVMDGVKATQKLKETYNDLPPIVGLSANAFEGDREKYMAMGLDEYLTKPVKKEDFSLLIQKMQEK